MIIPGRVCFTFSTQGPKKIIIVKIFDIHIKPSAENMSRIASGIRSDFSHPKIFIMNST